VTRVRVETVASDEKQELRGCHPWRAKTGARWDHSWSATVDRVDDLGVFDALQVDRGDADVGVAEPAAGAIPGIADRLVTLDQLQFGMYEAPAPSVLGARTSADRSHARGENMRPWRVSLMTRWLLH
jgi:hypothetical protein